MTQFYFRHGAPLSESDNLRVKVGARGESGYLDRNENCPRCGGQGGSPHWRPDGGVCYQCHGNRTVPVTHRVFGEARLVNLNAVADRKAALKATEAQRKMDAAIAYFVEWRKPHEKLLGVLLRLRATHFWPTLPASYPSP